MHEQIYIPFVCQKVIHRQIYVKYVILCLGVSQSLNN